MRTNIELDDARLQQVQKFGRSVTRKAAIQASLTDYLNTLKRQEPMALRGNVWWQRDSPALRKRRAIYPRSGAV